MWRRRRGRSLTGRLSSFFSKRRHLQRPKYVVAMLAESTYNKSLESVRASLNESVKTEEHALFPLSSAELEWLNDACLSRYFKAAKNDINNCVSRLIQTLKWRRDYRPDEITESDIAEEATTGKEFLKGFDKEGRPILYLVPARENSKDYDRMLKFVVFNLEKAIKLMPDGVESMVIIVDYKNVSVLNAPPISISKKFLQMVGDHYPERLGISFIMNPTWYLWVFFKLLRPFLDPVTAAKINLIDPEAEKKKSVDAAAAAEGMGTVSSIFHYIAPEQLLEEYGGSLNWKWNFEEYWKEISLI